MSYTGMTFALASDFQRLQRFSTYGHLKQIVLKMIVDEISAEDGAKIAIKAAAQSGVSPGLVAGLQVIYGFTTDGLVMIVNLHPWYESHRVTGSYEYAECRESSI